VTSIAMTQNADPPVADPGEVDRAIRAVCGAIAAFACLLALPSYFVAGGRFAVAVLGGGAIGVANFLFFGRIGKALTGSRREAAFWGGMYFVKIALLFGGLYLLLDTLPSNFKYGLLVGLCAIVPGIVVGGLLATPKGPTSR
jgi:hypothetical protein